jgi:hypothetical protein
MTSWLSRIRPIGVVRARLLATFFFPLFAFEALFELNFAFAETRVLLAAFFLPLFLFFFFFIVALR